MGNLIDRDAVIEGLARIAHAKARMRWRLPMTQSSLKMPLRKAMGSCAKSRQESKSLILMSIKIVRALLS